jgi:hypothetical protein
MLTVGLAKLFLGRGYFTSWRRMLQNTAHSQPRTAGCR